MDGGRMIHGVARTAPGYQVAAIDKDLFNRIEYQGNNTWYLLSDDELIDVFKTEDLRMTFVWRGLCFHDEAEKSKFEQHLKVEVMFKKKNDILLCHFRITSRKTSFLNSLKSICTKLGDYRNLKTSKI